MRLGLQDCPPPNFFTFIDYNNGDWTQTVSCAQQALYLLGVSLAFLLLGPYLKKQNHG